jgi:carboxymethylenebutenolidase
MDKKPLNYFTFGTMLIASLSLGACQRENPDERAYLERMAAAHQKDAPGPNAGGSTLGIVKSMSVSTVTYAKVAGKSINGYFARPADTQTPVPGIILIHEWWGLNENMRRMAEVLAAEGYAALAVDLYGGETARTPESAKKLMETAMTHPAPIEENLRQAVDFLKKRGSVKVGVAGWSFGGGWALKTAINMSEKIHALTIYYGQPVQDSKTLATLNMPILGIFAERDQSISLREVNQFTSTLKTLGKSADIRIYPNVEHAFANPSGEHYSPREAADAWSVTLAFLNRALH